jgi:iron-sulfur cluster assembly protein
MDGIYCAGRNREHYVHHLHLDHHQPVHERADTRARPREGPLRGPRAKAAIEITQNALKRIRVAMAKEGISPDAGGLRVGIQGGGCSGLSYNIRFDTQPRERDRTFTFGAGIETPNDPSGAQPVRIFVDPKSFLYLAGMVLDFEETLMRQGFNFINPNSTKSCGCGSSFSA